MKKVFSFLLLACMSSIGFAEVPAIDVAASLAHLVSQVKNEEPVSQVKAIQPDDLEKLNLSIDLNEDIHVVFVDYENEQLKHMKVDAFVVNNDIQLSTTYMLSFENGILNLTIEDFLTGLENAILPTSNDSQSYKTKAYLVECFKKEEEYHSAFKRIVDSSFKAPIVSGITSCHAPADDELQIKQKFKIDNKEFVNSIRDGIKANIQAALDEEKMGVSFAIIEAKCGPGKLLRELFESKLRVYLFNNVLSTLLKPDTPKTQETQPEEHKAQG